MSESAGQFEELGRLAAALCDGQIALGGVERLEQLASQSDQARRYFLNYVQLHGELYWENAASASRQRLVGAEPLLGVCQTAGQSSVQDAGECGLAARPAGSARFAFLPRYARRGVRWFSTASAASLLISAVAGGMLLFLLAFWGLAVYQDWSRNHVQAPLSSPVARLTRTAQASWSGGEDVKPQGGELSAGEELDLRSGLAEITFDSGVRVILQGPARFELSTPRSGFLHRGSLTANMCGKSDSFTIRTPGATIVDRGTEFGVAVEDGGHSEVHVFAGVVEVRGGNVSTADAAPCEVRAGQAVRVLLGGADEVPQIHRIAAGGRDFFRTMPDSQLLAGSVAEMRALVADHPRLLHHYTFEGATREEKYRDRRGGLHLIEVVMCGGRGGGSLGCFARGVDVTSGAIRPYRGSVQGNTSGVGLQSDGAFHPPEALTVELLLSCDGFGNSRPGVISSAVATRADRRNCGFFVVALDKGRLAHLMDGHASWIDSDLLLVPGDWYYLASTFRSASTETTINTYVANLSRGERALRQVVKDRLAPGVPAASRLGIGKAFDANVAHCYPWAGTLDEVAIYDAVLDSKTLQEHLEALVGQP